MDEKATSYLLEWEKTTKVLLWISLAIAYPCCPYYLHHARDIEKYALTLLENGKLKKYGAQYHAVVSTSSH
jgi:hypothetical protein